MFGQSFHNTSVEFDFIGESASEVFDCVVQADALDGGIVAEFQITRDYSASLNVDRVALCWVNLESDLEKQGPSQLDDTARSFLRARCNCLVVSKTRYAQSIVLRVKLIAVTIGEVRVTDLVVDVIDRHVEQDR